MTWLRRVLGMNKVVVEPTLAEERAMRRAVVVSGQNRRAHQARKSNLTHTGEMRIIQRRAERDWLMNAETVQLPRIEL